jgi:hypothetical protein
MKKFILTLTALVAMVIGTNAQSFMAAKDTAKGYASDAGIELHNDITNKTSSPIKITWRIISETLPDSPSKWDLNFGLCDNVTCYARSILKGNTVTTDDIPGNGTMGFKISTGDLSGVTNMNTPYYVNVELVNGSTTDTVTFSISKWSTSVSNVSRNDNVSLYPNPARNEVNVVFNGMNEVRTVGIYNLIGKLQSIYKVSGTSANINIETLPSGIYLMRLMDNQGHPVAIRKFNKL